MKQIIINLLKKEIKLTEKEIENLIEIPPSPDLGDYSFPCFILAGKLKQNPVEIAKSIAEKLQKQVKQARDRDIEKIQASRAYLNFFINKKILVGDILNRILKAKENFGEGDEKEKILLEHTSVNPNASPHVGRARNSIIGDSIYRILTFSGNKVETHYYVNDVSKQIALLALVFNKNDKFEDLLKKYIDITKKIENNPELEKKVFALLNKFEKKDKPTVKLFKNITDTAVKGQKRIFSSIGIDFDYFDYESRYIEAGKNILKELEKTGKLFKDEDNRMVLNQKGTELENKMKTPVLVLTRNDGTGLYPLRDLAYTIEKCKKGKNIIVLGEDQKLYFEQLKQALILLKKPYPTAIHYCFVLLKDLGKMSTRKGELVLLQEFLDEALSKAIEEMKKRKTRGDAKKVALSAVKYAMLRNENNKNITFDMNDALNFEGNSGPYLQYSYARASSILNKAKSGKKVKSKISGKIKINHLEEKEINLLKKLADFPDIVKNARKHFSPNLIANYSFELSQIFNEFYHSCHVLDSEYKQQRLKIVEAFRYVLKNSLYLLGIDVMNEM